MSGWSGPGRAYVREQIKRDQLRLLIQMAPQRDPEHNETPTLLELVTVPADRAIVQLILDRVELGRPIIAPPGIPADRLAMLREAFWKSVEDPEFLSEAGKLRLAIDPMNGADAQVLISRLYQTPLDVLERTRKIVQTTE
jgi:tripartite-type tricarboxylate transporter receptor subunit TctC